jgi:ankyrin repeat protein
MNAAAAGSAAAVRLLLQAGADYSPRDSEGHTALWHARDNESDEAVALLLAYGAYEEPEEKEEEREP